jgi:hypothetical protein
LQSLEGQRVNANQCAHASVPNTMAVMNDATRNEITECLERLAAEPRWNAELWQRCYDPSPFSTLKNPAKLLLPRLIPAEKVFDHSTHGLEIGGCGRRQRSVVCTPHCDIIGLDFSSGSTPSLSVSILADFPCGLATQSQSLKHEVVRWQS